ncbi:hypothetical protein Dimus_015363 [Dionaea muscipula]
MSASNMETLTASLERSLQNCSLNHSTTAGDGEGSATSAVAAVARLERSSSSELVPVDLPFLSGHVSNSSSSSFSDSTLVELNSHLSLPYHWEQCLDLKTGEIYYVNWRNGMKAKRDPRLSCGESCSGTGGGGGGGGGDGYCYSGEDEVSYDSEGSSTGDSSSSTSSPARGRRTRVASSKLLQRDEVLVVAGCKSCLMYFMLPKHLDDCPKCSGQLLHFDRSEHSSFS